MRYIKFIIQNYRAIKSPIELEIKENALIPLVGINECGKTTILQAIFCFDYINDNKNKGNHLNNSLNLYQTNDNSPLITAWIEISYKSLKEYINDYNEENAQEEESGEPLNSENEDGDEEIENNFFPVEIPFKSSEYPGYIEITRDLNTKKYTISSFEYESTAIQHDLSYEIIRRLPYILYNDDFNDRPPNYVKIPNQRTSKISEWIYIYERLFKVTDPTYSLFSIINEKEQRRKESIISDVQEVLNKTLLKAWRTFSLDNHGALKVCLRIVANSDEDSDKYPNKLEINIVEKSGKKDRYFDVVDRSKGFLWFFNFVMKLEFNPKIVGNRKETIYLLDEPGSYLHSSAQEKLCLKLKNISEKHGKVIYCTHSHHLLNPNHIPLNKIHIVEKSRKKEISVTPLPTFKCKSETTSAMQPIYEALQIPAFEFIRNNEKVILVEGIYDKYAIEIFANTEDEYTIFPGTSADAVIKNIQFMNAFRKIYIAIWDNDTEGTATLKKATKLFGEKEAIRFDLLPLLDLKKRRMEEMIAQEDMQYLTNTLKLEEGTSYERIISTLYFKSKSVRSKIVAKTTDGTKKNFKILKQIIEKRFSQVQQQIEKRK